MRSLIIRGPHIFNPYGVSSFHHHAMASSLIHIKINKILRIYRTPAVLLLIWPSYVTNGYPFKCNRTRQGGRSENKRLFSLRLHVWRTVKFPDVLKAPDDWPHQFVSYRGGNEVDIMAKPASKSSSCLCCMPI